MKRSLSLLGCLALAACAEKEEGAPVYDTAGVERRTIEVGVSSAGIVEPIATVEVKSKASGEVLGVIRELASRGLTMVLATHEMGFARDVANRVCFLHEGVVLESAPPAELFSSPTRDRTRQFLARVTEAGRL